MKAHILLILSVTSIWISCKGQQNPEATTNFLHSPATPYDTTQVLGNNLMLVYQDKKNNYWFGTWGDGLYKYYGQFILHFTTENGLIHNRIDEIKEDKQGNIYFNTSGGINKYDGQYFTTLSMVDHSKNEWKLGSDDLWFRCTQDSGLVYRYDGEKLHRLIFPGTRTADEFMARHPSMNHPSLRNSAYSVYTVYMDSRDNVWFGTAAAGVCRYDGHSFDWIAEEDVNELHNGPSNGVRSILEDKDGYFWFNTLYRYDVYGNNVTRGNHLDQEASWYTRVKSIGSLDGREDGDVSEYLSIARDNHDALWFATYRDGVWRYDGEKITHFPVKNGPEDITLFTIYKDRAGDLWLGTHETGAYKFNGKTFERFQPF